MLTRLNKIVYVLAFCLATKAMACGPWLPNRLLDHGGKIVMSPPEFFFELEMRALAKNIHPAYVAATGTATYGEQLQQADITDYNAALNAKEISPTDSESARALQSAARAAILLSGTLPEEFPSEFALYHKGAMALKHQDPNAASEAWKALLQLPPEQRRYRSTWAAFMLGRLAMGIKTAPGETPSEKISEQENPTPKTSPAPESKPKVSDEKQKEAIAWFELTRSLAEQGFTDTLGLAASSAGWQARVYLDAGEFEKAANLYLAQLGSGDLSGVLSLRNVAGRLKPEMAIQSSVLRRLYTADLLCFACTAMSWNGFDEPMPERDTVLNQWLTAAEAAKVNDMEEAERLGWIAYSLGKFSDAERWLKLADPNTGLTLWLKAKLDLRAGNLERATQEMASALPMIPPFKHLETRQIDLEGIDEALPINAAVADLGLLKLATADFVQAFHLFIQGDYWQDAAFVAERILSLDELKKLVDSEYPAHPEDLAEEAQSDSSERWRDRKPDRRSDLRWLLGRRLVRAGKFSEAKPYLPPKYKALLERYVTNLNLGNNKEIPSEKRARALFEAAVILRYNGMELMGTEVEPDAFIWDGAYPVEDIATSRLQGKFIDKRWVNDGSSTREVIKEDNLVLRATEKELKRLKSNQVTPESRFHYRYLAADLGWRSASLLPDGSQITADVLNTSGMWIQSHDEKGSDRFYQAIERRCPETEIGKVSISKHWFVDMRGPWSKELLPN